MSKMSDLAYDIEQLYIEGFGPRSIAVQLGCDLTTVYEWIEHHDLGVGNEPEYSGA
jgi:uncharacterized protein YjcR